MKQLLVTAAQNKVGMAAGLLLAVAFLFNLWGPPLFDLDEGAFSAATMEMLQRLDFVTTFLNGEPRFDKPILIYWFQALSTWLFGTDEMFYRLPSAIAAMVWVICVYRFARERSNSKQAIATMVFIASAAGVIVIGRAATADALLNLWIALAGMDGYRAAVEKDRKALWRSYIWIGLGLLTKGPVAAVVPFMALTLYALVQFSYKSWSRVALFPAGWCVAGIIALPWYIAEYLAQGQAFIDGFFFQHNLGRFTETMESHGGTVFYYVPGILMIGLPFSAWIVRSLASVREIRKDALVTWCWCWFVFVFLFFSFSSTQLPHYVLYGSTPLFLLMGRYWGSMRGSWPLLPALLLPLLVVFLPWILPPLLQTTDDPYMRELLTAGLERLGMPFRLMSWLFLVLMVVLLVAIRDRLRLLYSVGLLHSLMLVILLIPTIADFQQRPVKEAAAIASQLDETVVMWRIDMPSFSTYRQAITPKREPLSGELLFTREGKIPEHSISEIFYRQGGIMLVRVQ